ncbi:MAG: phenylacetate--CoA ligase [Fibrobacteres bacterium]|nr:phenylacetate--CoA ligase [Fibrobacterota bacterium]
MLNREIETIERSELEKLQLTRFRFTLSQAFKTEFYKKRFSRIGLSSPEDIQQLSDIKKIPFTTKDDLREGYPEGFLAVHKDEVVRLHASSGTTGMPTVVHHTKRDLDNWTRLCTRSLIATGATKSDTFQNMMTYGLFTGGLGLHYGAEALGMLVIPAGAGNTKRQIQLMRDFKTTVVHATPSYLLHMADEVAKEGITPPKLGLKKAMIGAEPHSENIRKKLEDIFKIDAYNSYGMSEMNGPGVAFECIAKDGMHLWEDAYYMEIINPESCENLGEDCEGELVLTTLEREATPLIRYRTRDLTSVIAGLCSCGRTSRRIRRIKGRSDDMLIINGVNLFPSQIEAILMKHPEVGTNYLIQIEKKSSLDKITVKTEIYPKLFSGEITDLDRVKKVIHDEIKSACLVNASIEFHEPGSLPVSQGKAVRVSDLRKEE